MSKGARLKPFDPSKFVHSALDTWRLKEQYDAFLAANPHLAAPFHVTGLERILPRQFPTQVAAHFGKSHEGKSTAIRNGIVKSHNMIKDTDSMVGVVSLEDTAETTAAKFARRYGDPAKYQDNQLVFIGNSAGMTSADMNQLNVDNIIKALEYALQQRPAIKRYSHIFFDYIQIVAASDNALSRERRDQATYAARQLFDAAKQFSCPVSFSSQALLKGTHSHYAGKMRIPGRGDLKEASELYEIPDIVIAYWMPKMQEDTPPGTHIEDGSWSFKVETNLIFIKVEKWRNCELQDDENGVPFDVVGRTFPCWIQPSGEIIYDKEKHKHMQLQPVKSVFPKLQPEAE